MLTLCPEVLLSMIALGGWEGYVGRDRERTGSRSRKEEQFYDASKRRLFFNVRAFYVFPALLLKPPCGSARLRNGLQERVDGITSRLAFELRFVAGIELEAYQAYVETAVSSMLQVGRGRVEWSATEKTRLRPVASS